MQSPSFEIFKSCVDVVLGKQLEVALLEPAGLEQMTSRGLFQPQPCCAKILKVLNRKSLSLTARARSGRMEA